MNHHSATRSRGFLFACAVMALALTAGPAAAQVRGTISGYVKDPTDAALPGARVTLRNEQTGAVRETTSNQEGFYQFLGLTPGVYTLEAELASFRSYRATGIQLRVDENLRADIRMELGAVTEQVQVTAAATVVETRSSTLAAVMDDRRIVDLPLLNRNVISLAALLPGVTQVWAGSNSDSQSQRGGPTLTVNGGRRNQTYETLNNTYFNNPSRNTGLNPPPPDAVQEFRMQTANYSAESGRNAGAVISVVTRSGTNDLHGAAWEFHRSSALNARSFFEGRKPVQHQNQFGAAAGGPIKRDKVFYFASYEGIRDRRAATTTYTLPPSAAEARGDFSHLARQLRNPYDGTPIPGNRIPDSLIDPAAKNLLQYLPVMSAPGERYIGWVASPRNADLGMIRNDWTLSSRQSLFGHYYLNQSDRDSPNIYPQWISNYLRTRTQNAGINHTFVIRPTLLNQLTLGFTRSFDVTNVTKTISNSQLLLKGLPDYIEAGATSFSVSGRFSLSYSNYLKFISNNYDIAEGLTWIKGRHTFKFGFQYLDLGFFQTWSPPPSFSFNGTRTGDPMADFLTGAYRGLSIAFGQRLNDGLSSFTVGYFQDDFKVTRRLTLNYGLRYELPKPWVDKQDRINTLDLRPGVRSKVVPSAPPHMLFVGDLPRGLYETDKNNFAPRFGFAWDVFGDGKTAVRGAWGLFYDTVNTDSIAQENPPFAGSTSYFNGRLSDPVAGRTPPPVFPDAAKFEWVYPINLFFTDLGLRTPYTQQWNLTIERQFGRDISVQAAYVGKDTKKLHAFRPWNVAIYKPGVDASGRPLSTLENAWERAPFLPGVYGTESIVLSSAFNQHYESAQFRVDKRFSNNFSVLAVYTLGKAIDFSSTHTLGGCIANPYDLNSERGRADFDARHTFAASWLWTPVRSGKGLLRRLVGGWNFSGIHRLRSGYPITFFNGDDVALGGDICGGEQQHPDLIGNPKRQHSNRQDMITKFFNTEVFRFPAPGHYGSAGRNILSGPASSVTDLAILKDFMVTENSRLQLRGEFSNAFNQVNFGNPRNVLTDGLFGRITSAAAGRAIQVGLKYIW